MEKLIHQNAKQEAYKFLPAALPLQNKEPNKLKSAYQFVQDQCGDIKTIVTQEQELYKAKDNSFVSNKKVLHVIGQKLADLFQNPVYKSHGGLDLTDNNKFGSVQTNENFKIESQKIVNETSSDTLQFESRFQSGNLALASCSSDPRIYFLALQRDINAKGLTTQWFFFRVSNKRNLGTFTFNIVNYVKPYSMYKNGMKPCIYSVKKQKGWQRAGFNIEYKKNTISYEEDLKYYTLSFNYQFQETEDQVYFAYCYPYTYSRLQSFLDIIEVKHSDKMRRKTLTRTLGDNVVEMISITNPQYLSKRVIFITARAHPGQTIGSFTCEGIINFLLSSHPDAEKLRTQFIIKIIPMLNPDGVINGNYRTSLSGDDLNRQWKNPSKNAHPEVFTIKKMILQSQYKKILFMDIHGHSKKKSSFMYGCVSQKNPYIAKQLPYVLSKKSSYFNYFSCNFTTPKCKQGTSRMAMWRSGGIDHSYTYEISFCGPQKEKRHFNIRDYQNMGIQLCKNLSAYFCSRILGLEANDQIKKHCEEFYEDQELINIGNEETNGSSSQLEDEIVKVYQEPITKDFTKKNKINTERSDGNKMSDLFQRYVSKKNLEENSNKKKIISIREQQFDESQELLRHKKRNLLQRQGYLRQRQSLMATKVNIQQMQFTESIYSSMYTSVYGLAAESSSPFIDHPRISFYKNNQIALILQNNRRNQKTQADSFGILLPNVAKNHYKRYQRMKKGRINGERSNSLYVQNIMKNVPTNSNTNLNQKGNKFSQEISLVGHIRSRTNDKR